MNKKGFTLIELITTFALATVIIIILLNIVTIIKNIYVQNNIKSTLAIEQSNLSKLMNEKFSNKIKNYQSCDDSEYCYIFSFENEESVKLVVEKNKISFGEYTYKLDKNTKVENPTLTLNYVDIHDENNQDYFYNIKIPIFSKLYPNKDFGIDLVVPSNSICILKKGERRAIGSKYSCEVKPGTKYDFYVLSYEDDGTTNLIMDRNICEDGTVATSSNPCLVAWNSSGSNADGPVIAMNYLYNATKSWINIPSLNYTYNDRNFQGIATDNTTIGYTSFVSNNGEATITALGGTTISKIGSKTEPLKARMPIYTRNSTNSSKKEVTDSNGSNEYLYENLDSANNGESWHGASGKQPTNNISGIYGYWTLSSDAGNSYNAWIVFYYGGVYGDFGVDFDSYFGVRAVINLKL